jgi:hypothetical protein
VPLGWKGIVRKAVLFWVLDRVQAQSQGGTRLFDSLHGVGLFRALLRENMFQDLQWKARDGQVGGDVGQAAEQVKARE